MATKDISDLQVVLAYLEYRKRLDLAPSGILTEWPYEILERRTGQPRKVCYRAMERAECRGFIESGVSLRSGWVTYKGTKLAANEALTLPPISGM